MKSVLLLLSILVGSQTAFAEITTKPIQDAEVVAFDALCTPTSASEGSLTVNMQVSSGNLFVRGNFFSFSRASAEKDQKNWNLVPLKDCQNAQSYFSRQAGRKIALSGQHFEQPYDAYEEVWGACREHPMVGRGTYPCKRGTRKVIKYHRETVLNFGTFQIVNINN